MRYPALDLMRGLGAIAVLFFHMGLLWHVMPYGYLAVDIFFALSGFVMAMTYELNLQSSLGMSTGEFMTLRLQRLYPTYLVGVALGIIVLGSKLVAGQAMPSPWIALNVFMLPAPIAGDIFPLNVPAWSLFLELVAYLAFAIAVKAGIRRSTLVLTAITGGCFLLASSGIDANAGSTWAEMPQGLARLAFAFSLGWLAWRCNWRPWGLPRWLWRPAAFLGAASYPLYVIHYPLLSPIQLLCRRMGWHGPVPAIAIAVVLVTLAWGLDRLLRPRPRIRAVRVKP